MMLEMKDEGWWMMDDYDALAKHQNSDGCVGDLYCSCSEKRL
jgi:hypothetical protein